MSVHVIEGPDYGRVKLLLRKITRGWPSVKTVWADGKDWAELDNLLISGDNVIVRKAELLGERYSEWPRVWRFKNLCFVTDTKLKRGVFSRKIKRMGKSYSMALGKEAKKKIEILTRQLALPGDIKANINASCFSVSEALNVAECYAISGEVPRSKPPALILLFSGQILPLLDYGVMTIMRQLAALAAVLKSPHKGWIILNQISRVAPGATGMVFNIYMRMKEDPRMYRFLVGIGVLMSKKIEEIGTLKIPTSYFLLLIQDMEIPLMRNAEQTSGKMSYRSRGRKNVAGWRQRR